MAYVSEYISDDDKTRIGFARLVAHNWRLRPDTPHRWVIDRQSGNWLFKDYWGDEENRERTSFTFFWAGNVVRLEGAWRAVNRSERIISAFQLTSIPAIFAPETQESEFYSQLQNALTAHAHVTNPESIVEVFRFLKGQ